MLKRGWVNLPDYPGYGGSGAPGKILKELLAIDGSNFDTPDAVCREIKFHSGNALLKPFRLESAPKWHIRHMVRTLGWPDNKVYFIIIPNCRLIPLYHLVNLLQNVGIRQISGV